MKRYALLLAGAALMGGCQLFVTDYQVGDAGEESSSTGSSGGSSGSSGSGSGSGSSSGGSACTSGMQSGTVLCQNVIKALCMRRVQCLPSGYGCTDCSAGGGNAPAASDAGLCGCSSPGCACTQQGCEQAMMKPGTPMGYDCSAASFTNATVCVDTSVACINAIPSGIACSDSMGDTWVWPPSCATFWLMF